MVEFRNVEWRTTPIVIAPGEKLVIRLWSWDEQKLLKDAEDGYYIDTVQKKGEPPEYYSISTFALTRAQVETVDELGAGSPRTRQPTRPPASTAAC